jgi:hypothetical protein
MPVSINTIQETPVTLMQYKKSTKPEIQNEILESHKIGSKKWKSNIVTYRTRQFLLVLYGAETCKKSAIAQG